MKKLIAGLVVIAVVASIAGLYIANSGSEKDVASNENTTVDSVTEDTAEDVVQADESDEEYVGQVITLEQLEGITSIYNAENTLIELRESSKLFDVYEVYTEEGYVWIALDDNGVLKMDMDTQIEITKTGDDLEILLVDGEIFFNISESFAENESLSISTSTMTTGIRGTSGIISTRTLTDSSIEFSIKLLEGHVELTYLVDNATDTYLAEQLEAGQKFSLNSPVDSDEDILISTLTDIEASDVNGFVAVEIRDDEAIQEKILSGGSIIDEDMLTEIIGNAEEKLEEDQVLREYLKAVNSVEEEELISEEPTDDTTTDSTSSNSGTTDSGTTDSGTTDSTTTDSGTTDSTVTDDNEAVSISIYFYSINGTSLSLFATQAGDSQTPPMIPYLQPSESGSWSYWDGSDYVAYDFIEPFAGSTVLVWIEDEASVTTSRQ